MSKSLSRFRKTTVKLTPARRAGFGLVQRNLLTWWRGLTDQLFPSTCALCGQPGVALCASCAQSLPRSWRRASVDLPPGIPVYYLGNTPNRQSVLPWTFLSSVTAPTSLVKLSTGPVDIFLQ